MDSSLPRLPVTPSSPRSPVSPVSPLSTSSSLVSLPPPPLLSPKSSDLTNGCQIASSSFSSFSPSLPVPGDKKSGHTPRLSITSGIDLRPSDALEQSRNSSRDRSHNSSKSFDTGTKLVTPPYLQKKSRLLLQKQLQMLNKDRELSGNGGNCRIPENASEASGFGEKGVGKDAGSGSGVWPSFSAYNALDQWAEEHEESKLTKALK